MQEHSFDGFSFRELAEAVGIRKASIYHHFDSKESIAVEMLNQSAEHVTIWANAHAHLPPVARLEAYCFDLYAERLGAGSKLCPAGAFTSSWSHLSEATRTAARRLMDVHLSFLSSAFEDGLADRSLQLPRTMTTREAGQWFAGTVQGALTVSRAYEGLTTFRMICETTLAGLAAPSPDAR